MSVRQRLLAMKSLSVEDHWLTRDLAIASFEFPKDFFQDDDVIIIGWLHFLAFDLLAGRYIWNRMVELDRPIYVSTPILILSMMVAPFGFLLGLLSTWESKSDMLEENH